MSGVTRKRMLIGCVLVLVCGVVAMLLGLPSGGLTCAFQGYETNNVLGIVTARIEVRNTGRDAVFFVIDPPADNPDWSSSILLQSNTTTKCSVPVRRKPSQVVIVSTQLGVVRPPTLANRARFWFDRHVRRTQRLTFYTLDIPE